MDRQQYGGGGGFSFFTGGSRFQPMGLPGAMMGSMMGQQMMNSSSVYKNIHTLKTEMPTDVLELFKANQVGFVKPMRKRKCRSLDPICFATENILERFSTPMAIEERPPAQTKLMRQEKKKREKAEAAKAILEENIAKWNPYEDAKIQSDPFKTLIVSRLKYQTPERSIKMEFEKYGSVKSVRLVLDQDGQSRGYAFVEYDRKEDFVNAYKNAHLRKIDGRRIAVDFEKGRSILIWRPRRLGGGEGTSRLNREEILARQKVKALEMERKETRRRERGQVKDKQHKERRHSRSRSRERKDKKKEREKEKDRDQNRDKERNDRTDRQRDYRDYDRPERTRKADAEPEDRDRKEKKKDRSRSHKKDKKDKKEKKQRKEYVAVNVSIDEFRS